jgi:large subunit ribosomal protein L10
MPNLVTEILLNDLKREFAGMGSCVVLGFDKLQPKDDLEIRKALRSAGIRYRVVKNRLASRAFAEMELDMDAALQGKCGIAMAPKEGAIKAARLLREVLKKHKESPVRVLGGVIEGEAITGAQAAGIADMPDRDTVNTQLVTALSGPARSLATAVNALAGGLARCLKARLDKMSPEAAPEADAPPAT